MRAHTRFSGASRWHAYGDTGATLLAVLLLHGALFVSVSAHPVVSKDAGARQLLQASLIVGTPPKPEPPPPKPVEVQPEPPRPKPPKAVERPKPKRMVAQTPKPAPTVAAAPPEPPPAPPVPAAAPAVAAPVASERVASEPAAPQPMPPRFDAAYLNNPPPAYPSVSRRLGEEGKVMLRVFVEPNGTPSQVKIHQPSGFPRLDAAALDAVRQWRFVPARQGTDRIGAWVLVPVAFNLRT